MTWIIAKWVLVIFPSITIFYLIFFAEKMDDRTKSSYKNIADSLEDLADIDGD